jgi:hypothetical protein
VRKKTEKYRKKKFSTASMCVYESESERGEREESTRENNFVHGKLLAGIHEAAIRSVERGGGRGGGGKRRKSKVLFLVGSGCLI